MSDLPDFDHDAFWTRGVVTEGGCRLWTGPTTDNGYGLWHVGGKTYRVHRVAFELAKGPIPVGLVPDHLCFIRLCYEPDHLEAVTQAENNRRAGARKTHCPRGHAYDEANTYCRPSGARFCRACAALRDAARYVARAGDEKPTHSGPRRTRHV